MQLWEAIVVGAVQGLAEFLPISSSGHIVLTQFLLGIREVGVEPDKAKGIAFEVMLHMGTLLSVLFFFRARLISLTKSLVVPHMKAERVMILWLAVASVPAVIAYVTFKKQFEAAYHNPVLVSGLLLVTGALLFVPSIVQKFTPKVVDSTEAKEVNLTQAIVMGVSQAFAILPGISRSGSTIAAGLTTKGNANKVAEFSFLMSLPAIGGGFLFSVKDIMEQKLESTDKLGTTDALVAALQECFQLNYVVGAIAAAIVGLLAIYLVMGAVKRGKLTYFSYYCFAAGIAGMIYFSLAN